ncbi:deoxyuridine 5'-triphosphate nucleotidohydrolase-like [Hermetia illucens]|uniref:deoxyuridine 5'-triphosphate nucleotidohydrolase-like n=1 Tax=Hermetia illucens TaxID=343691 RepID=UPI0018CC16E5|nr:deoxyuridine 5'-triphosphate nucleotidohydrolase-like [Hermetia illucens]
MLAIKHGGGPMINTVRLMFKVVGIMTAAKCYKAHTLVKGSAKAAGFNLKSAYDYVIPAHGKEIYGRVAPRSGLAAKNFIDVGAAVIDENYRGNVGIVLFNHSDMDFEVKSDCVARVAQLICERILYPTLMEEKSLEETARDGGSLA